MQELLLNSSMSGMANLQGVESLEMPVFEGLTYKNSVLPMQQAGVIGGNAIFTGFPQPMA